MDFSQKYDLMELMPGEGVESYRARQTNTGRDVTVHLLVGGKTPANETFLLRLRGMHPQSMAKLIEVGEHKGNMFVVTVAPPYQRLDEWLADQDRVAEAAKEFGKASFWKRPTAGVPSAPPAPSPAIPPPPPPPVAAAPEPGEFTKQFSKPVAPAAEPGFPSPSPMTGQFRAAGKAPATDEFEEMFGASPIQEASPPPPPAARKTDAPAAPGDFTMLFQGPAPVPAAEPGIPLRSAPTEKIPLPPSSQAPGEFTRMFQDPAPVPAAEPEMPLRSASTEQVAMPPSSQAPGEFTRMFQSSEIPDSKPGAPPVSAPAGGSASPGEFTRMFQSPVAPPPAGTSPSGGSTRFTPTPQTGKSDPPGEFTMMFNNSPLPDVPAQGDWPPPAPKAAEPGEFTKMFQVPPAARQEPSPPPAKTGTTSEFSQYYRPPAGGAAPAGPQFPSVTQFPSSGPPPAAAPPKQEPGEFTRMFPAVGPSGMPPPTAAPPPPPSPPLQYGGGSGATQAFRAAPGPAPGAAPPPGQQGPSEYTMLISRPVSPGSPPPPPPAAPAGGALPGMMMPQVQMPQMPQVPQIPQVPQMQPPQPMIPQLPPMQVALPQAPAPPPVTVAPKSGGATSNTLLIAIFCLLAFLAGGIVVYLLARR